MKLANHDEKQALVAAGYSVENMGAVWGSDFVGRYRWINETHENVGGGFGIIQYSEDDAWADAMNFQEQELHIPLCIPEPT